MQNAELLPSQVQRFLNCFDWIVVIASHLSFFTFGRSPSARTGLKLRRLIKSILSFPIIAQLVIHKPQIEVRLSVVRIEPQRFLIGGGRFHPLASFREQETLVKVLVATLE